MSESYLFNPHDKFFKESFSRKEIARSFIQENVPDRIHRQLDYETLTIIKDSYTDKEMAEHYSDIVYSIKLSGKNAFIYLLFEHKSASDLWTGFQLLRYMVKIWELYRKQNQSAKKLPVIVPIVIYQGKGRWKTKSSIGHLFESIENMEGYIPEFMSEVFEISQIPDEQIKGDILLRVMFLAQKYSGTPQMIDKLKEILALLSSLEDKKTKKEYLETFLRYLSATTKKEHIQVVKQELEKVVKKGDDVMTTIAEYWIQEGEKKGRLEGKREGKLEGKLEVAKKMIVRGMSNEDIVDITGLDLERIELLRKAQP